jgi:chemotaxis protein MotA
VNEGATSGEIAEHVGAAMVGTFIGIFFCYGLIDPICNMMKQLVSQEASNKECVKVVLVTHVAGKPPLLAIDAGRRLVALNVKPSFAQLERWINDTEGRDSAPEESSRRGGGRAKAA